MQGFDRHMELGYLKNHQEAIPLVARWYLETWSHRLPGKTQENIQAMLQQYLNTDKVPLMILAIEKGQVLGVAQLKFREMDIYPEKEHWLGGVFVEKKSRGRGIAAEIIKEIIHVAKLLDVSSLHLQTIRHDGGLYRSLGWEPLEIVTYKNEDVLVMEKKLLP